MTASPVPTFRTEITRYTTPSAASRVAAPPATFKDLPSRNWIFCPGSCNRELISSGRWPRDTIWREDDQHAHHSNGPRAMATLRNMTFGLFAIHGITKLTVQSIGRNPLHAVRLIT